MKKSVCALVFLCLLIPGCEREEIPKSTGTVLDYYIESHDLDELGYTIQQKVMYEYNEAGNLSKYSVFNYNLLTNSFVKHYHFEFSYVNDQVNTIKGYFTARTTPYVEYSYHYLPDSRVLKIIEDETGPGANEANFTYNDTDESVKVSYSYKNGGSFEYEFNYSNQNILSDKAIRGSLLCSDGTYTYDQNKNPFNNLGYTDYQLINLSANNRLTENINYVGCTLPSLIPESYRYEYNANGYPTVAKTIYKSGTNAKSEKKFFYR